MRFMAMTARLRVGAVVVWTCLADATAACDAGTVPPPPPSSGTAGTRPSASAGAGAVGDDAAWYLDPQHSLQESSTTFTALVVRVGCNNGVTGEVLPPDIRADERRIVVTFSVAPRQTGAARCQGNNQVPYQVDLGEPLRDRILVDGRCLPPGGEKYAKSVYCEPDSTRYRP
jgi:hypothetical protein